MSPVVNKEAYRLYDEEAQKRGWHYSRRGGWYKITTYSSKDREIGGFKINVPDYMQGVLGYKFVRGFSQDEVDEALKKAIREYTLRVSSKKKVIVYQLLANVADKINGKLFKMQNLGFYRDVSDNTVGLALWYQVGWETYTKTEGRKYYDLDGAKIDRPTHQNWFDVMEYSPEREAFFKELRRRIAGLTFDAHEFLSQKKDLIALIDQNMSLPFLTERDEK